LDDYSNRVSSKEVKALEMLILILQHSSMEFDLFETFCEEQGTK